MTAKTQPAVESGKICFSYIRFSSVKQASGDSQTRQAEIAPRIAKEKGWRLRTDLNLADLGLSALKKQNVGSLKAVQAGAESGKIPKGSVMIIEALDRLTRAELDTALDIFRGILRAGLEIYVDKSSKHYTRDRLNNITDLIISVVELAAANDYSAKLADRVASAWKRKRDKLATGEKLTKKVPSWIDKKTWQPIPDKAAIVKRVFTLYANGVGRSTITRTLNHEKVTPLTKAACSDSSIHNILHSRAVIREFTPCTAKVSDNGNYYNRIKACEPIKNYFTKHAEEDSYTVEGEQRDFKRIEPFAVTFSYPLMWRNTCLNPANLKTVVMKTAAFTTDMILRELAQENLSTAELQKRVLKNAGMKDATFFRLWKQVRDMEGVEKTTTGKWSYNNPDLVNRLN